MVLKRAGPMFLFVLLAVVMTIPSANANILAPGGVAAPDLLPGSAGPFLANTGVVPYVAATFNGVYDEAVFAGGVTAVCPAGGCMVFQISVTDAANANNDPIASVTTGNFSGWLTDVGIDNSGLVFTGGGCKLATQIAPASVYRSGQVGKNVGAVIGWDWNPPNLINPGDCSAVLLIETNAPTYQAGLVSFINSSTATVNGFAPAQVVEPASTLLLSLGMLVTGLFRKKLFA